jgi:predicted RNA-binding Zn-ribbon protein involved in translation (DUF1610 family)
MTACHPVFCAEEGCVRVRSTPELRKTALKCPACGERQALGSIRTSSSFSCEECGARIRIPSSSNRNGGVLTIVVSAGLSFLAGARGWHPIILAILGFVPIGTITNVIQRYWFPPTLEIVDESDGF